MKQTLYGKNPVFEWLRAELPFEQIWMTRETSLKIEQDLKRLIPRHISIQYVNRIQLSKIVKYDGHQGIALEVRLPDYAELGAVLKKAADAGEPPLVAILDHIQDPQNLGAILRSADGAGFHGVIVPKDQAVGLTPAVFKASAGAAAHMPLVRVTNLVRTIQELKEERFWFAGTHQDSKQTYTEIDYKGPMGIIMGSEGKGIRPLVEKQCDYLVSIPMHGQVNSLNVSIASALLFFEARRQRRQVG